MNGYAVARNEPYWSRAWTIGGTAVGAGVLAIFLDLLGGSAFPQLWLGVLDFVLGLGVAALVLTVTAGHRPVALRIGVGLLVLFVSVFFANLLLVAVPAWA